MTQIRFRLGEALDRISLRDLTESKTLALREDEPHPVRTLLSGSNLRKRPLVDGLLRLNETVEVERIHRSHSSPLFAIRAKASNVTTRTSPACTRCSSSLPDV